jgi:hypothetical protein
MKGRALHSAVVHLIDLGMNSRPPDPTMQDGGVYVQCAASITCVSFNPDLIYSFYEESSTSPKQSWTMSTLRSLGEYE